MNSPAPGVPATLDPFQPAALVIPSVAEIMKDHGATAEAAVDLIEEMKKHKVYVNNTYQVNVSPLLTPVGAMWHLSIKRRDKQPIHDWRDLQQIKNMIVDTECEAVELYPAESRLVDSANQYHLFCFASPKKRFPFGFEERLVSGDSVGGVVQRPFVKHQ